MLHIGEAKDLVILKIKGLKRKNENLPSENPSCFTEFCEVHGEGIEIDNVLFFELEEGNKNIYNQAPVNTLIGEMEKLKFEFFTNGYFTLDDEGEIGTKRFLRDSNELAKVVDKILEKFDDQPSIFCTVKFFR